MKLNTATTTIETQKIGRQSSLTLQLKQEQKHNDKLRASCVTFSGENAVFAIPTIPPALKEMCFYSAEEILQIAQEAMMENESDRITNDPHSHNLDQDTALEQQKSERFLASISSSGPNMLNATISSSTSTSSSTSSLEVENSVPPPTKGVRQRRSQTTTEEQLRRTARGANRPPARSDQRLQ